MYELNAITSHPTQHFPQSGSDNKVGVGSKTPQ